MKKICFTLSFLALLSLGEVALSQESNTIENQNIVSQEQGIHIFTFLEIGNEHPDEEKSVSSHDFNQIIDELTTGNYNVVSLESALSDIPNSVQPTVSLTFDGGYQSFYNKAWPVLKDRQIPFTVFITPEQINRQSKQYMDWNNIKDIADNELATIGIQSDYFVPYTIRTDDDIRAGLNRAIGIFEDKLGFKPAYVAYPFGLYDVKTINIISEYDFIKAGFGLQSSVASSDTPRMTLPRFILTGNYADIGRFNTLAMALPLPVSGVVPSKSTIIDKDAPTIGFTISGTIRDINGLTCFGSGYGAIKAELLGHRVELRFDKPLEEGKRLRINCTLPYTSPEDGTENWYWYGMLVQPR